MCAALSHLRTEQHRLAFFFVLLLSTARRARVAPNVLKIVLPGLIATMSLSTMIYVPEKNFPALRTEGLQTTEAMTGI